MHVQTRWKYALVAVSALSLGWLSGSFFQRRPIHTYEDCILTRLSAVNNSTVASAIVSSCRAKFPGRSAGDQFPSNLHTTQLAKLTGRAGLQLGNSYGGNIYNGNNDVLVTDVDIAVTAVHNRDTTTRIYRTTLNIPPFSAADFSIDIVAGDAGSTYSWSIAAARGTVSYRLSDLLADSLPPRP